MKGWRKSFQSVKVAQQDDETDWINVIDGSHHEIHEGRAYFAVYSALKNDAGTIEVRIEAPNTARISHMTISIDGALAYTAELWANTTKTDVGGNRLTSLNRNFNSSNVSGMTICHTPGGAQAGAATLTEYVGSATVAGKSVVGGGTGSRDEFMLNRGGAHLIKVTSRADNNALTIKLSWYEHQPTIEPE